MRLRLKKRGVWLSVLGIGIAVMVAAGLARILPRASYYLERANYHNAMEQSHRAEAQKYKEQMAEPSPNEDYLSFMAQEEAKTASLHASLKKQYRQAAFVFWECPSDELPLPYPWDQDRDRRVLETALIHVTNNKSSNRLESQPSDLTIIVHDVTTIGEFSNWFNAWIIPSEEIPINVAADLQRRNNEGPLPVAPFKFRSHQIVIDDLDAYRREERGDLPEAAAYVRVSLPGYSRDGKIAVVCVSDALGAHYSGRVLALILSGGEWRVAGADYSARE
jgi:hypothetical protein